MHAAPQTQLTLCVRRYASLARQVINRPIAARSPAALLRGEAAALRAAAGWPQTQASAGTPWVYLSEASALKL